MYGMAHLAGFEVLPIRVYCSLQMHVVSFGQFAYGLKMELDRIAAYKDTSCVHMYVYTNINRNIYVYIYMYTSLSLALSLSL